MDNFSESTRDRYLLRDLDLTIGGEMHRKIYDVEIPARLNKLVDNMVEDYHLKKWMI